MHIAYAVLSASYFGAGFACLMLALGSHPG